MVGSKITLLLFVERKLESANLNLNPNLDLMGGLEAR